MYQRALQGRRRHSVPEHTSTLDTVNNLGLLYANQGKLDEAEKMYQRALQGGRRHSVQTHVNTRHG
jgi:Tfp pilus assembly protein PilF